MVLLDKYVLGTSPRLVNYRKQQEIGFKGLSLAAGGFSFF